MKKQTKTIWYSDPLSDDFAGTDINAPPVPSDYVFVDERPLYKAAAAVVYEGLVRPLITVYIRLRYRQKFVGLEKLRSLEGGAFVFANHTMHTGDAFIPNMTDCRRKNYIVTGPDAVGIKGIRTLVKMLGAIPLPSTANGMTAFAAAIERRYSDGATVTIYPEAHIWPYYTGIRPFRATSFRWPARLGAPVFALTNVFHKKRFALSRLPRVVSYLDGPFYPDPGLPERRAAQALREQVYAAMTERASLSDYEYIRYRPIEEKETARD
ncbi:MAG: 1-acyl-sn-glycerol-3-phosphate acyltransferase [Oscillospiraceae bacterium]|nr:1-acyl-sn-glycerol-3-phosphate acyltransferase [Oscillospiraceae bacterium]